MSKVKIFSKYDVPPQVACPLEAGSNVDKESGKFTDINFIVKRYLDTGGASGFPVRSDYNKPIYGDFSKSYTINDVLDLRANMSYLYDELSPEQRAKFVDFNDFLKVVGSSSDEDFVKLFSVNDSGDSTPSPVPAPENSGAEASGIVQSSEHDHSLL